jgi:hypothetical protein
MSVVHVTAIAQWLQDAIARFITSTSCKMLTCEGRRAPSYHCDRASNIIIAPKLFMSKHLQLMQVGVHCCA